MKIAKENTFAELESVLLDKDYPGMGKANSRKFALLVMLLARMDFLFEPYSQKIVLFYLENLHKYTTDDLEKFIFKMIEGLPFFKVRPINVMDVLSKGNYDLHDVDRYINSFDTKTASQLEAFGYRELFQGFMPSFDGTSNNSKVVDKLFLIRALSNADYLLLLNKCLYLLGRSGERNSMGAFYTSEPLSNLMARLLLLNCTMPHIDLYDPACGIGMPLLKASDYAQKRGVNVCIYGQDISNTASAELLFKVASGTKTTLETTDIIRDDKMRDLKTKYILSDLPFGIKLPYIISNAYGINAKHDATMLYVDHIVNKLDENGRAVFTLTQSQFDTTKENKLIQELVEKDILDSIVMLPSWIFSYTAIPTCLCVIDKNKPAERTNKVQIIDMGGLFECSGVDRFTFSNENEDQVLNAYIAFEENEFCRILSTKNMLQYRVTLVNSHGDEVTKVTVPADESDPINYLNKNYISMMDGVEIDYTSIVRFFCLDLESLFVEEEVGLGLDELEVEANNYLKRINVLTREIFGDAHTNIVAEEPVERVRKYALSELAEVRRSAAGRDTITTLDNGMPIISVPYIREGYDPRQRYVQNPGAFVHAEYNDIVIINYGENAGEVMLAKEGYLSQSFYKVEITGGVQREYLYMYLKANENAIRKKASGVAQKTLRKSDLMSFRITLPEMETQAKIVDKLKAKISAIDEIMPMLGGKAKETMINYRQALIADAIGRAND